MKYRYLASAAVLVTAVAFLQAPLALGATTETDYERAMAQIAAEKPNSAKEHDKLWRLFDTYWTYTMTQYPEYATSVGFPGQNGRWTDMSLPAIERRKRELQAPMKALKSINRSALDKADQRNYDIFEYELAMAIAGSRFPDELMPINQLEGAQEAPANNIDQNPTVTVRDYEDIISRLRGVPTIIDQSIELMKAGLKANITPPKVTLTEVPQQIKNQIVDDPMASPLLQPFKKFPSTVPAAEQERLKKSAATIYSDTIAPAYRKLHTFFTEEYLPHTRDTLALTALPNGKEWYAHNIRSRTTTQLSPEEIHKIGLEQVKLLRAQMEELIKESGFKGNFQEFSTYVRTDPKFFHKDKEALLVAYRDIAKRIDPMLMKQFGTLPRQQYGIEPVPAYSEKSQPTAYYRGGTISGGRAGVFYANTYKVDTRPKWEMEALTLHEAVPGHHLQIALAQEMENVPEFRKHTGFTAYTEGWGLYSEGLGRELGLYQDPYSRYGQLTYDMWRSIRLVLDTGIHSMGWTRQQAIDFFRENCAKSDHDIEVEVDRYIVWPGQATAYKIGQLTFQDLKKQAQRELGDRYDVRAFHDAALGMGTLPLDTLKAEMSAWMAQQKAKTALSTAPKSAE